MENTKEKELKMGENVIFTDDYMIWGSNAKGMVGMFYKEYENGNCLVYVPEVDEWGEPHRSIIKSKSRGRVPRKNKALCDRMKTMVVTYGL